MKTCGDPQRATEKLYRKFDKGALEMVNGWHRHFTVEYQNSRQDLPPLRRSSFTYSMVVDFDAGILLATVPRVRQRDFGDFADSEIETSETPPCKDVLYTVCVPAVPWGVSHLWGN